MNTTAYKIVSGCSGRKIIEQILCKIGAQSSRMPCRDSEGVLAV